MSYLHQTRLVAPKLAPKQAQRLNPLAEHRGKKRAAGKPMLLPQRIIERS